MIEEISIRDLGVIGEARLPLGPGFTALTGETGAGKTMVVTALGLLLGERADSAAIRSGSQQTVVEGHWVVPATGAVADRVRDAGGDLDETGDGRAQLILGRSVSAEGRSRATVGGRAAPVGVLNEIGRQLVVVHGQSDQVRLRSTVAQREALDRFGGPELAAVLSDYAAAYRTWHEHRGELDVLVAERDRRAREAEELRIAMAEIEAASPERGEDERLAELAERLTNVEDLRIAATEAREAISSQELSAGEAVDALALVDAARRSLERMVGHDPALGAILETATAASFALSEISGQLSSYLGTLDTDGARELEGIQERRAVLNGLMRRYGSSLDEVIDYLESGSSRLLELDSDSDRIESLGLEVEADRERLAALADRLSELRRAAAVRLEEAVSAELGALAMPDASIVVEVAEREFGVTGRDEISILLQPHAGAEPRPLGRGASGGELSRVMLAIEVVLAASDPVPTFVFDEVDAGVGGASATEIGRRLARLAQTAQVIVVTHLAQVAAFSTNHLVVEKGTDGSVTASSIRLVHAEERTAEMARLLSGQPGSESALAHARELLDAAHAG
ncbi:DNA repair protein RecN [Leifsonia sp. H3M29-4]|uniref:DNA repair protein RecN n=1 Tax=Salinibacterium metalliresistens TaxID=3031321 RepID=UPI0023DCB403|nr:DNA repair protein RecN [Salinibacterium metalliresistens]MDF1479021.1 DNA repair protein RecN [Salinibacterium metalliresistens]